MNSPDKSSVNKPMSIWKRPVELNFIKLLPLLGKGAIAFFLLGLWRKLVLSKLTYRNCDRSVANQLAFFR